ncbi:hypothetical protein DM02DRAFT_660023 [Periconia macrospinosa]|uniref:Uncharacterized protein n=1 Tax=Periconia macrospinosa TaxID=97972 RepID=A0A2V1DEH0_9PLEO|nr:hypothetical protein DM02DRAFT_660023 [Periconia macrospinosa]
MKTSTVLFLAAAVLEPVLAVDWGTMYEDTFQRGANSPFRSDGNGDCGKAFPGSISTISLSNILRFAISVSFTQGNVFWNDKVSSLIINPRFARCTFYVDAGCSGASADFGSDENARVYSIVQHNDAYSSFQCSK